MSQEDSRTLKRQGASGSRDQDANIPVGSMAFPNLHNYKKQGLVINHICIQRQMNMDYQIKRKVENSNLTNYLKKSRNPKAPSTLTSRIINTGLLRSNPRAFRDLK